MSRSTLAAFVLVGTVGWTLACSGLIPMEEEAVEVEIDEEEEEEVEEEEEPQPPPEPASLFDPVEPASEAPAKPEPCPEKTTTIRYQAGRGELHVYCASGAGKKHGPWSSWKRRTLLESRTYVDGVQQGTAARWSDGKEPKQLVLETWVEGTLQGAYAEWDVDGQLMVRGELAAGKRQGRFLTMAAGVPEEPAEGATQADDAPLPPPTFGGACFQEGEEAWTTVDPVEFVEKDCG
jgi:hypothetical protein